MEHLNIQNLGAAGAFIVVVLYITFDFVKSYFSQKKKNENTLSNNELDLKLKQVIEWHEKNSNDAINKLNMLYNWHNKEDADGVKIWYNKRALEESIQLLIQNISSQNEITKKQVEVSDKQSTVLAAIAEQINKQNNIINEIKEKIPLTN